MDKNVPIPQDTVLTVNSTGHIINQWGNNFFFLPHMITIDKQNNVWVTDVAMHQVKNIKTLWCSVGHDLLRQFRNCHFKIEVTIRRF